MPDLTTLCAWVKTCLPSNVTAPKGLVATPIAGDAGFRTYYRLNTSPSLVAVIAPPEHENNPGFVQIDLFLRKSGVHVPEIHAVDFLQGFLLLEDLGDGLLLPRLNNASMPQLYDLAERVLAMMQAAPPDEAVFPGYDRQRLEQEMALFPEWFVEGLLDHRLAADERQMIESMCQRLADSALMQPQVVVHRDFHSRNLLWIADDDLGVVDFQDAVVGPFTYDLVSLLKDCYIRWPAEQVRERALMFLRRAYGRLCVDSALPMDGQLLAWFDWMGLQRHLKVLGIFARLSLRDGKHRYLEDLPLVLRYTLEVTSTYDEFNPFDEWFRGRLMPLIVQQPWYQAWQQAGDE